MRVGVLHNSVFPHTAVAGLAVSVALDVGRPLDKADGEAVLVSALLKLANTRRLMLRPDGTVHEVQIAKPVWLGDRWEGAAVRRGDPVIDADGAQIGVVSREIYCVARNGRIVGGCGGDCVAWYSVNTGEGAV